jgi:HK97 family phage prohead protease
VRTSTGQRIETRSATAVSVSSARRELDLIIAPAETPTVIFERGERSTEVFSHGAFAGCEKDPGRVRVNRDHVRERVIGRALRLDPWDEQGLTGTVKLARVRDADDALALIDDGLLAVSAGFAVANGGDERHGTHRRARRATLDHIALVPEPAYESATIAAIRGANYGVAVIPD